MRFRVGAATDNGRVRSGNEDSHLVATNLCAVADGMGGHQGGEVASAIAVDTLRNAVAEPTAESLIEGVKLANQAIFERQADTPELHGMGTTLCAVALVETADDDEEILVVNVGDSRVYLFHDDELSQITRDHSLVEDLRLEGRITDAEAAVHPHRNVLTRALGIDATVQVDDFRLEPRSGDRFLLCSDGLFNEVPPDRLAATLRRLEDPADVAHELVRLANENGGRDNITSVVVDIVADDDKTAVAPLVAGAGPGTSAVEGDDLAGFSRPIPEGAGPPEGEEGEARSAAPGTATGAADDEPVATVQHRRRFTWRVTVFLLAFLVVLAAAAVFIVWQGRGTYYVAFDKGAGGELIVYQGTPGGLLGINPTVYRRCQGLTTANVPTTLKVQIQNQKTFTTFPDAREDAIAYVSRVEKLAHASCTGPAPTATTPASTTSNPDTSATTLPTDAAGRSSASTTAPTSPAPSRP